MHVLVRVKGGCGGETLVRLLAKCLNHEISDAVHDNRNRAASIEMDVFYGQLLSEYPRLEAAQRFDLPLIPWKAMPSDAVTQYVSGMRADRPTHTIGMSHYVFGNDIQYQQIFPQTFFVDTYLPSDTDGVFYPDYDKIKAHHISHGWYPSWWTWDHAPIGTFEQFIDRRGIGTFDTQLAEKASSDMIIEGGQFVTDALMSQLQPLLHRLGIYELDTTVLEDMDHWIHGNITILKTLNLSNYIDKQITVSQQFDLLKQTFLPIYNQLIENDSAG